MLNSMTAEEYVEWVAYFSVVPFSDVRGDIRTANQIFAILRGAGSKEKMKATDFLPDWWGDRAKAKNSPEQLQADFALVKAVQQAKRAAKMKKGK